MNEPSRIKELQAQIEQLSAQLQDCHQKLLALHRELKQLQKSAEPDKVSVPHVTSKNHLSYI